MTKNDVTTIMRRNIRMMGVSELYGTCDSCDTTPALRDPATPWMFTCPKCRARKALEDGAQGELELMLFPVMAAWAQQWHSAGLSREQLGVLLELYFQYNDTYTNKMIRIYTRQLLNVEVPAYEEAQAARVVVHAPELLCVVGTRKGNVGEPDLMVKDRAGRVFVHSVPHGLDALMVFTQEGDATLIFIPSSSLDHDDLHRYSVFVPGRLVPTVNAFLAQARGLPFDLNEAEATAADD